MINKVSMYRLRKYQEDCISKLLWSNTLEGADLAILPTGSGKSLVIAELAHRLNKPILILQPTKEILEQNLGKMCNYVPDSEIGVYSASMGRKDIEFYTFATIQSIYRKPELFKHFGVVIIDECHLVNPKNLDGMYTRFFREIGEPKIFGLSATPYRLDQMYERLDNGDILTHTTTKLINRLKQRFWHRIVYNLNIQDLINQKYLVPLRYIDQKIFKHEDIPTNKSKSDFDMEAFYELAQTKQKEILEAVFFGMELGKHVLVFCSSVRQAEELSKIITNSEVVSAKTKKKDRERIIKDFRTGKIKTVFNVGVFTTGFDFPELDCIVLLRPTQSIALYSQMLGRGVRSAEGKKFCYVIDTTGTVNKMGRIETVKLEKQSDGWALRSETCENWHYRILYSFLIKRKRVRFEP